jgi:hypothetical protein
VFKGREHNYEAHTLANWARIRRESMKDFSYPFVCNNQT